MCTTINQKEYLKKYLSGDINKKSKKKKKRSESQRKGIKVIDDCSDLNEIPFGFEEEDEAPTIAEITYEDEKLKEIEQFKKSGNKWKNLETEIVSKNLTEVSFRERLKETEDSKDLHRNTFNRGNQQGSNCSSRINFETSPDSKRQFASSSHRKNQHDSDYSTSKTREFYHDSSASRRKEPYSDASPPGIKSHDSDTSPQRRKRQKSNVSPPRKIRHDTDASSPKGKICDSDASPPRRKRHDSDASPRRRKRHDSDASSQRRKMHDADTSPQRRKRHDSDVSPPRKMMHDTDVSPPKRKMHDSDASSPRRKRHDSDDSPPRRKKQGSDASPHRRKRHDSDASPPRRKIHDSNVSPPRKVRHNSDDSPPRRKGLDSNDSPKKRRKRHDSDVSSPRKMRDYLDASPPRRKRPDSDASPQRRKRHDSDTSLPIRKRQESDASPLRRKRHDSNSSPQRRKMHDSDSSPPRRKRHDSYASPPRKSLLDADHSFKRYDDLINKESNLCVSSQRPEKNMTTVDYLKARKFGKLKKDSPEDLMRREREAELQKHANEMHKKWNKGVLQGQKYEQKVAEYVHEAGKSFARQADDIDMNDQLKNKMREEDPMLDYIMKKKIKEDTSIKFPIYQGSFPPNRFNIRPGFRWDGVDRSTGYEKEWFSRQNSKKATDEESYKWSIEDM